MLDAFVPSAAAIDVLKLLARHHNVLLSGPPATGKSVLMAEVERGFKLLAKPTYDEDGDVPFPNEEVLADIEEWLPSPDKVDREVFSTVFHPHSKHRDFVRGIAPRLTGEPGGFQIVDGRLYEAAEYARAGAALLTIDEINRGPAVQLFGESITAFEHDKRLAPDGGHVEGRTRTFPLLQEDGSQSDYALSHHLYTLAAMNQADTSVEPLDVAFLRRWERYDVMPDVYILGKHFDVDPSAADELPDHPQAAKQLYLAAARAWQAINDRIELGRGVDYQIGQGALMDRDGAPHDLDGAIAHVHIGLQRIRTHVEEVFFGDLRAVAHVFNVDAADHPWRFDEANFAGDVVTRLQAPTPVDATDLMKLLKAIRG